MWIRIITHKSSIIFFNKLKIQTLPFRNSLTLVSAIKDPDTGLYRCFSQNQPWCPNKCVGCMLNVLPNVKSDASLPSNFVNKADADWNPSKWGTYFNPSSLYYNLSGEFVDSFSSYAYTRESITLVNIFNQSINRF